MKRAVMFWERAKKTSNGHIKMSPLDRIRQEEANATRQILLARQEAEAAKLAAKNQAAQVEAQARQTGAQAGQAQYELLVQETIRAAELITAGALAKAEAITQTEEQAVREAVQRAVNVVLGMAWEEHNP